MVAIIGTGLVGATTAYALMLGGTVRDILLVDINHQKAEGEAMDLNHGTPFVKPVRINAGSLADCRYAEIIVIAAGVNQKEGQSRLDLLRENSNIIVKLVREILKYNPNPLLVMVTNPVDVLSYTAWRASGLPFQRVIGSGTVLDSARFRHLISSRCGIAAHHVHAYVVGEHGDSEVPLWSTANIGGVPLEEICCHCPRQCNGNCRDSITQQIQRAAYEVIEKKGATYYAVALAVRSIVEAILRDEKAVQTVSTLASEQYPELEPVYMSLPCLIGARGIERILPLKLPPGEKKLLFRSASVLSEMLQSILDDGIIMEKVL